MNLHTPGEYLGENPANWNLSLIYTVPVITTFSSAYRNPTAVEITVQVLLNETTSIFA
jgi:hypothetical protein